MRKKTREQIQEANLKAANQWVDQVYTQPPLPMPFDEKPTVSPREKLLQGAVEAVTRQRNNQYGPPSQDFTRTAAMWTALFGREFTGHEVAMAMVALKLSRLTWDPTYDDSWMDIAGYVACGFECTGDEAW